MTLQKLYAHVDTLDHIQKVRLKDESLTRMVEHAGRVLELSEVVEAGAERVLQLEEGILIV